MDIHKPKPVRSWRELFSEIGVIVLGVSLALAAEQTVEYFHWRHQVQEAREVIASELTANLVSAVARMNTLACTERRLDTLAVVLDTAAKTGSLPPLGDIGMPPRAMWPSGAWNSVVASQTATHFPRRLLVDIASTYKTLERLEDYSPREVDAWNMLYPIVGPGRRLDPSSEARLREAISQARTDNRIITSLSMQFAESVAKLPLSLEDEDRGRLAAARKLPLNQWSVCKPVGATPLSYGHGYDNSTQASRARMGAAMKGLRDLSQ